MICVFFGSFNPIHDAHIKMAELVLKNFGFEKIIFVPAYIPPHKDIDKALAKHRYNMVKIAIKNNPKFEISDIEYKSEEKSYSINTVKKIKEMYNINGRLNFIIGTDAFKNIKSWYKSEELKELVHFIVFPRGNDIIDSKEFVGYDYEIVDTEKLDISSTEIRNNEKQDIKKEVKDYIREHGLYN